MRALTCIGVLTVLCIGTDSFVCADVDFCRSARVDAVPVRPGRAEPDPGDYQLRCRRQHLQRRDRPEARLHRNRYSPHAGTDEEREGVALGGCGDWSCLLPVVHDERSIDYAADGRVDFDLGWFQPYALASFFDTRERLNVELDVRAPRTQTTLAAGARALLSQKTGLVFDLRRAGLDFAEGTTLDGVPLSQSLNSATQTIEGGLELYLTPLTTFAVTGRGRPIASSSRPRRMQTRSGFFRRFGWSRPRSSKARSPSATGGSR